MKSLFDSGSSSSESKGTVPPKFGKIAEKFVRVVRGKLGANEVRAFAASPVASPVLQVCVVDIRS